MKDYSDRCHRPNVVDNPSLEGLVDGLIDAYVAWRDACDRVNEAYRSWVLGTVQDDRVAFGVYVAALDAEERAAEAYAACVRRVYSRLWGEKRPPEALEQQARD